ncbi:MAG: BatD family protein [Euryarchaeota archaeon]|nr:BatD family protein [Euryarchaeota archaeon]
MKVKKMIVCLLLITALSSVLFAGSASAKDIIYEGTIKAGQGYQINNYVIDVTDVFPSSEYASFYVYEKDTEKFNKGLDINDTFTFEIEGEDVEVTLIDTVDALIPRANIVIIISDNDIVHTDGIVDGGHEDATFSGTPVLEITKTVSPQEIAVGDTTRVTVSVTNTGDDDATDVRFSDPIPERFVLQETFVSQTGEMSLNVGDSQQIFIYQLKATEAGSFTLGPTTATFSNEAGSDFPQVSSNSPILTVEEEDLEETKKEAELQFTTSLEPANVQRKGSIDVTVHIKNTGDAPAEGVTMDITIPDGLEFEEGDDEIEVVAGVPKMYFSSFGLQQEKEISFRVKANSEGTYTITTRYSYQYDNAIDEDLQEVSSELTTNSIQVVKGQYDYLLEQPIYVYAIPLVLIIAIGGWVFYRHRQYRF